MTLVRCGEGKEERSLIGQDIKFMLIIQVCKNNTITQGAVILSFQYISSLQSSHTTCGYTNKLCFFISLSLYKDCRFHLGCPFPSRSSQRSPASLLPVPEGSFSTCPSAQELSLLPCYMLPYHLMLTLVIAFSLLCQVCLWTRQPRQRL